MSADKRNKILVATLEHALALAIAEQRNFESLSGYKHDSAFVAGLVENLQNLKDGWQLEIVYKS